MLLLPQQTASIWIVQWIRGFLHHLQYTLIVEIEVKKHVPHVAFHIAIRPYFALHQRIVRSLDWAPEIDYDIPRGPLTDLSAVKLARLEYLTHANDFARRVNIGGHGGFAHWLSWPHQASTAIGQVIDLTWLAKSGDHSRCIFACSKLLPRLGAASEQPDSHHQQQGYGAFYH